MKLAMFISGGGTTAAAVITACQTKKLKNIEPVLVIASGENIDGIKKVKNAGMDAKNISVLRPKDFNFPEEFGEAILQFCQAKKIDLIGQYGWLCKTPPNVVEAYEDKMINQHPGPLDPGKPDFGGEGMYGRRVHAARLEFVKRTARDFWSEATAQRVAAEFDAGAVLKRRIVPILPNDTVETLQARMLPEEHLTQIETLADFASGKVKELTRLDPLVLPREYPILELCKKIAIEKYPKG